MKKIALYMTLATFLASCSNLSKNNVKTGVFKIRNGVSKDIKWNETLRLNRYSWYQEMTLQYDVMLGNIPKESMFNNWFSDDEKTQMAKCGDFKVLMTYAWDTSVIANHYINRELDKAGYKKIEIPNFAKNINLHADSIEFSLNLYKISGICRDSAQTKPLELDVPGFSRQVLN